MAYDEELAVRIRNVLTRHPRVEEKKMFGGIAFMLNGHMCVGVVGGELMVRVGEKAYDSALSKPHAREMDFTGRPLRGFVYVGSAGVKTSASLKLWVERGEDYVISLPPKAAKKRKPNK